MDQLGQTPILPCTWLEAQAHATAGLDLVMELPSGQLVRVDPRLAQWGIARADALVPADLIDPGTPWTLRTAIGSWSDPASLPAGWAVTAGALAGGLSADLVLSAADTAASYLTFAFGAAGTVSKIALVSKNFGVVAGNDNNYCGLNCNLNNLIGYYRSSWRKTGVSYRRFGSTAVAYPNVIAALVAKARHMMRWSKPVAAEDASVCSIPDTNTVRIDGRMDGLGAWAASVAGDSIAFAANAAAGGSAGATVTIQDLVIYAI
jgi:hypothetical protein